MIVSIMLVWIGFAQFVGFDLYTLKYLFATQLMFYFAVIFSVCYFVFLQKKNSFKAFWGFFDLKKNVYLGFWTFVVIIGLTTVIDLLSEKFLGIKSTDVYKNIGVDTLKYLSVIGVVFAPFAEEVFFRGFLQPVFVRRFGQVTGVFAVCFLFSILHLTYLGNISAVLSIISVGLILSSVKEISGSLVPSFVAHFLNNLCAVWIIFYM